MYSRNDYRNYLEYRLGYSDDFLAHYGVLGMRWGVRKSERLSGRRSELSEKRNRNQQEIGEYTKKLNTVGAKSRAAKAAKYQYKLDKVNRKAAKARERLAKGKTISKGQMKKIAKAERYQAKVAKLSKKNDKWQMKISKLEKKNAKIDKKIARIDKKIPIARLKEQNRLTQYKQKQGVKLEKRYAKKDASLARRSKSNNVTISKSAKNERKYISEMKKYEKDGLSKLDYEGMQREKRNRAATAGKYALASTLGYPGIGAYQIARTYTNRDFTAMNNTNNISTRVSKKDREKLARKYNYIRG